MKNIFLFIIIFIIIIGTIFLYENSRPKYKLELDEFLFKTKKTTYKKGEKVKIVFSFIATDTDYTFYIDGKSINPEYKNNSFIIQFKMPDHDVKVDYDSKNTMEYVE